MFLKYDIANIIREHDDNIIVIFKYLIGGCILLSYYVNAREYQNDYLSLFFLVQRFVIL